MRRAAFVRAVAATGASAVAGGIPRRALGHASPTPPALSGEHTRDLIPVRVSLDEVTRTTVGLRPYRAGGFILRAEGHDRRTIVHDYGHGGGGMSLSWGTALLAAELVMQSAPWQRDVAVIGCGVIGLSTALVLQDAGFVVSIYARDVPPDTTSNMSGAQWSPTSVFDDAHVDTAFRAQYARAARLANRRYQTLLGEDYGVRWIENYDCRDDASTGTFLDGPAIRPIRDLYPEVETYGPGQHPFPTRYATRFLTMLIEPNRYLRSLLRDCLTRGGHLFVRDFASMTDVLASVPEPIVMNCTGLGAKALTGDDQLEPVRGQLSVLAPQPAVDYITLHGGRYMFPRSDGVVLGGTFQHGDSRLDPDPQTERQIVADHATFFEAMGRGRPISRWEGSAPQLGG